MTGYINSWHYIPMLLGLALKQWTNRQKVKLGCLSLGYEYEACSGVFQRPNVIKELDGSIMISAKIHFASAF